MSDGAISQDEIDALLSGVDMGGVGGSGLGSGGGSSATPLDTSAVSTIVNTVRASLKSSLETMTGSTFDIGTPQIESVVRDDVLKKVSEMVVCVLSDFNSGVSGDHLFVMPPEMAQKLTSLINKEDNPDLDEMALSVVSEIVSQHVGSEITEIAKMPGLSSVAANPAEAVHVPKAMVRFPFGSFVAVTYPVNVDGGAYSLLECFGHDVSDALAAANGGGSSGGLSASEMQSMASLGGGMNMGGAAMNMGGGMNMGGASMNMGGMNMGGAMNMGGMNMGGAAMNMGGMGMNMGNMGMNMGGMGNMGGGMMGNGMPVQIPNVQTLQYPNLQTTAGGTEQGNIGLIMDVYMEMTVELGRTKKSIKDILGMGEGTIIELEKLAGEPVDILVNHKLIACGEVVVIDENFGVRVTKILSPMDRIADTH
ncbi:MAG: flagellar motor switch protein FliN [Treponemataceae bacterium]|nr:flagellar motor switch protein FliN [Treponemataceae bacterium]